MRIILTLLIAFVLISVPLIIYRKIKGYYAQQALYQQLNTELETKDESASTSLGVDIKSNWRQLKQGLNREQIKTLLGEPDKINVYNLVGETWWYGSGYLEISTSGLLTGWTEPISF